MFKSSNLNSLLESLNNKYESIILEEGPFPMGPEEGSDEEQMMKASEGGEEDPTKTPEPAPDENPTANNANVSDIKLALFADTLLKAYLATPTTSVPDEFRNATRENANDIIQWVESQITLDKPTKEITNSLASIN